MVQFIRLRGEFFGLGFGLYCSGRTDGRTASQLLSWREAARITRYQTCTAHYFSMRNLRLSKNFLPFGRRVAVRTFRAKLNKRRLIALTPL